MKNIHIPLYILIISTTLLISCTLEVVEEPRPNIGAINDESASNTSIKDSISSETINTIPVDLGEIGFTIDVRQLVVFGFKPTKVSIEISGSLSSFSLENIEVDAFTHMATFKLARKDLSDEIIATFAEGVPIKATTFDADNSILETISDTKFIISGTTGILILTTSKQRTLNPLKINPDIPHYLVLSGTENQYFLGASKASFWEDGSIAKKRIYLNSEVFSADTEIERSQIQKFTINSLGNDTYTIKTEFENSYLEYNNGELLWNKDNRDDNINFAIEDKHKFIFKQTENGLVKIQPLGSSDYLNTIYDSSDQQSYLSARTGESLSITGTEILEFQILAASITWEFNDLGASYSEAIIPPTKMDFAFAQTIVNCSAATGEYYVGIDSEETRVTSMSFQESANLFSSKTDSKSVTAEVEASGKVFGAGVSVSASGTLASSQTTAMGKEKTVSEGIEYSDTETVSSNRKITVPPYTAVEVVDVIQKLDNVRIPFVQRFFVRGQTDDGIPLSGEEIESQFLANRFQGVIILVGGDYLEYSIRGATMVSNYFDFRNTVSDIDDACN
ncbi:MAG: hypothetical protein ACI815_000149 [Psychroserpens sp.]|jgi:hypothetical protein